MDEQSNGDAWQLTSTGGVTRQNLADIATTFKEEHRSLSTEREPNPKTD